MNFAKFAAVSVPSCEYFENGFAAESGAGDVACRMETGGERGADGAWARREDGDGRHDEWLWFGVGGLWGSGDGIVCWDKTG